VSKWHRIADGVFPELNRLCELVQRRSVRGENGTETSKFVVTVGYHGAQGWCYVIEVMRDISRRYAPWLGRTDEIPVAWRYYVAPESPEGI